MSYFASSSASHRLQSVLRDPRFGGEFLQHLADDQLIGLVVFGDQHPQRTAQHRDPHPQIVGADAVEAMIGNLLVADRQPQPEVERAALAMHRADADLAAHLLDDAPADREPKAGAAEPAVDRDVGLGEIAEQRADPVVGNADAGVDHAPFHRHAVVLLVACSSTLIATRPRSVNFTALEARLSSTWRIRAASPFSASRQIRSRYRSRR